MAKKKGFTLFELIMVLVILGILTATALPRFIALSNQAREYAARHALGAIRSVVAVQYAKAAVRGRPAFPATIEASMFSDNHIPIEPYSKSNAITIDSRPPDSDGIGWRYDNVKGRVWINDKDYSDF